MGADEQLHDLLQHGMMRQPVKGWETKDLVVDGFKFRVILEASSAGICYSIKRIAVRTQPAGMVEDCSNVSQERIQVLRAKQASNHHVSVRVHLCSESRGIKRDSVGICCFDLAKRLRRLQARSRFAFLMMNDWHALRLPSMPPRNVTRLSSDYLLCASEVGAIMRPASLLKRAGKVDVFFRSRWVRFSQLRNGYFC